MSTLWEVTEAWKPPRTRFLDFPLGCPAGRPHDAAQQRDILGTALMLAPQFRQERWEMKTLPFQWSAAGRTWEQEVDDLYRNGGIDTVIAHRAEHKARGESLVGSERSFATKCNC
jgi:hypothetical protein